MSGVFSWTSAPVDAVSTAHRNIRGEIPAPGTSEFLTRLSLVESRSMQGQMPLIWDRAEGYSVYDSHGNQWIDFTSTIFVANVGHANPRVMKRVREVLRQPLLSTYAFANEPRLQYLEELITFVGPPFEKAFLLSAGTEATEATLKLMRLWGSQQYERKYGIVTVRGNWHGRTMGAQAMSSNAEQSSWVVGDNLQIFRMDFPYPWLVDESSGAEFFVKEVQKMEAAGIDFRRDICGFFLESFQGWGALFYPKSFVQELSKYCHHNEILLAFDEMQSGFGRTGKCFGFEHYEVVPDLFACGKGMGGGFPISGVVGTSRIMDLPQIGEMSSTHSANPVSCAAGRGVIEALTTDELIEEAKRKGEVLKDKLLEIAAEFPEVIRLVSSKGLIAAIIFQETVKGRSGAEFASEVALTAMRKGVLVVHTGRESIKLGPPLVIEDSALLEGIRVLSESIVERFHK